MIRFILTRLLQTIPVLLIISMITFTMMKMAPGGPFDREKKIPEDIKRELEAYYHLDKPAVVQYGIWLKNVLKGDLGPSTKYSQRSVNELIGSSFPVSLELGLWALLVALTLGISAGMMASSNPNSAADYGPMSFAMGGICMPNFVLGPLLVLIFAIHLGWYNANGWFYPSDRVLPALTLGLYYAAYVARLTRGGMLEILGQDFIRTARAKGLKEGDIVIKHAFRGGIRPVVSFLGPAMASLLSGSFVVETIFQIPGLGRFFILAAINRDDSLLMGTVLMFSVLIIVLNMIVDIVLVWLNPRLRFE